MGDACNVPFATSGVRQLACVWKSAFAQLEQMPRLTSPIAMGGDLKAKILIKPRLLKTLCAFLRLPWYYR
jgi:hypothetical protein